MNKKNAFDILMGKTQLPPPTTISKPLHDTYRLMFDGGSRGNPGLCGAGAVIYKNNHEYCTVSKLISGKHTNNYAEYTAFILGLQKALDHNITHLLVEGDSKLVINQCKGTYKVNNPTLIILHKQATSLCNKFEHITLTHILRQYNQRADQLANQAMDSQGV